MLLCCSRASSLALTLSRSTCARSTVRVRLSKFSSDGDAERARILVELSNLVAASPSLDVLHSRLQALTSDARNALPDIIHGERTWESQTVAELRAALRERGLPSAGLKADLVSRLQAVHKDSGSSPADELSESLTRVTGKGPQTGIFTDGSCSPNPGPGGWSCIGVENGVLTWKEHGGEIMTTNNRMELLGVIAALRRIPEGASGKVVDIYSDSDLCVKTLTLWAPGWERKGWVKGDGNAPSNLDLVKEAFKLYKDRPSARLTWIKAHDGSTWNEFADETANFGRTEILRLRSPI